MEGSLIVSAIPVILLCCFVKFSNVVARVSSAKTPEKLDKFSKHRRRFRPHLSAPSTFATATTEYLH
eukprot:1688171-Amphidinium_carterae.1